eukprot:gnl/MRDRNA2_/MRDRNA2_97146_c0_seq1.p1 gnl/MRDRNA2_/MRDRNA2_97146_c0~~gnl/MRDRNA2_/MRDRNA2_97146_c0_seq1.p1  ORF type:complete len:1001 (+),score=164.62 gnl/MRDRNA2_/MRDRNA2_97146_c0_seq1:86-3088(+)
MMSKSLACVLLLSATTSTTANTAATTSTTTTKVTTTTATTTSPLAPLYLQATKLQLNETTFQQFYSADQKYIYSIVGLPASRSPCGMLSRWRRLDCGSGSCNFCHNNGYQCPCGSCYRKYIYSEDERTTSNGDASGIYMSSWSDAYYGGVSAIDSSSVATELQKTIGWLRDVNITCASENSIPAKAVVKIDYDDQPGELWQHVHSHEHNVYDFTSWVHMHPGGHASIEKWASMNFQVTWPSGHHIDRFESQSTQDELQYLGKYGDEVDVHSLPWRSTPTTTTTTTITTTSTNLTTTTTTTITTTTTNTATTTTTTDVTTTTTTVTIATAATASSSVSATTSITTTTLTLTTSITIKNTTKTGTITTTSATTPTTTRTTVEGPLISVSMTLNIDYQQLSAYDKDELKSKVSDILAKDTGVDKASVSVTLTPGSVKIYVTIQTSDADSAESVERSMKQYNIVQEVVRGANSIPGVKEATNGELKMESFEVKMAAITTTATTKPRAITSTTDRQTVSSATNATAMLSQSQQPTTSTGIITAGTTTAEAPLSTPAESLQELDVPNESSNSQGESNPIVMIVVLIVTLIGSCACARIVYASFVHKRMNRMIVYKREDRDDHPVADVERGVEVKREELLQISFRAQATVSDKDLAATRQHYMDAVRNLQNLEKDFNKSVFVPPHKIPNAQGLMTIMNKNVPELVKDHTQGGSLLHDIIKTGLWYIRQCIRLANRHYHEEALKQKSQSSTADAYAATYRSIHELVKAQEGYDYKKYQLLAAWAGEGQHIYNGILEKEEDPLKRLISSYLIAEKFSSCIMVPLMKHLVDLAFKEDVNLKKITIADIKGISRVCEKTVMRPDAGLPWDMVRAMCVCEDMKAIETILRCIVTFPSIDVLQVNDRFTNDKNGWADCALYITAKDEEYKQFVGEIQIVHSKMLIAREQLGAHHEYDDCRFGAELLWMRDAEKEQYRKRSEMEPYSILEQKEKAACAQTSADASTAASEHSDD